VGLRRSQPSRNTSRSSTLTGESSVLEDMISRMCFHERRSLARQLWKHLFSAVAESREADAR
jgi:hypothetical protein